MLHVGARITGAALSLASPARSLNPACSISSVSQVAPSAVAEGRHFAGVLMKKWFPLIPAYTLLPRGIRRNYALAVRAIADLGVKVRTSIERGSRSLALTLIAGIPSRGIACVYQKPTPAVSKMASSVVSCSTISSTFALAKSEGGI